MMYCTPGQKSGTRLMLISEVALGSVFTATSYDTSLTSAPDGYNSVLGARKTLDNNSQFQVHDYLCLQWSLTYPDTSVPRLTVRITEFPVKWITFC